MIRHPTDTLDESAICAWLQHHIVGFTGPITLQKFAEGQSNPTYRVDATSGVYVLRRQPFGDLLPSAHAVDREFRLLSALYPLGFPVPEPLCLCENRAIIGSMFYVMEMVAGRNERDGCMPNFRPTERRAAYHEMTDALASLHTIDPTLAGLSDYGRAGNYLARQTNRWIKQYRASETERIDAMEQLIAWLPKTTPSQDRTAIVHGDFRIDNAIFAAKHPKILGVLDWELSTLGDPLADFSYYALNWVAHTNGRASLVGADLESLGIPSLGETIERYCDRTGRASLPNLNWYFAYNLFRMASIVQGIKRRAIDGNASSAHAAEVATRVPALAEAGWAFSKSAGA